MELWDWSLTVSKDAEMKARIPGVKSMMTTFDFYFGCTLGEQLLRQTDNLGRTVAPCKIHPPQLLKVTDLPRMWSKHRTDTSFSLFWTPILQDKTTEIQTIEGPKLPRKRKVPVGHELGEQGTVTTTFLKLPKTITNESTLLQ